MIVDAALYRNGARVASHLAIRDLVNIRAELPGHPTADGIVAEAPEAGAFVWVGLHEPTVEELEDVAIVFGLHPLAVEDALKARQRPKLEVYEDSLFITLRTVWYVEKHDAVETGEIHLFVGQDFVVTVRHGEGSELGGARSWLERSQRVLRHGPSSVVYTVCDLVVDGYERVAAALEDDVDEVEKSVFSEERTDDSARIYTLKREIAEMRRAVHPLRDPLRRLVTGAVPGIDQATAPFFRDVADHLYRVVDTIDALDLLLSTAFEAHLASISVHQNEDMRKLSAAVTLIGIPTLIAGVYGMNFERMPELGWPLGYLWALGLMLSTVTLLYALFKRSGWL